MNPWNQKKIGIWGFGIVGKSALRFFSTRNAIVTVMNKTAFSPTEHALIKHYGAQSCSEKTISAFFERNEYVLPSPTLKTSQYEPWSAKIITEADIFYREWKKQIIGITGTLGKTTTTTFLHHLLQKAGHTATYGGNIGVGMLDLLHHREQSEYAVLELSSFQLKHARTCAPDIAILTNFYPNHLDHHSDLADYFDAKAHVWTHQETVHNLLLPAAMATNSLLKKYTITAQLSFFSPSTPTAEQVRTFPHASWYFWQGDTIICRHRGNSRSLLTLPKRGSVHPDLWLIAACVCILTTIDLTLLADMHDVPPRAHRMELVTNANDITVYNDSKATVMEATLSAVSRCANQPVHLLLGGQSKGVDRQPFFASLGSLVAHAYCFGSEAQNLYQQCVTEAIPAHAYETLEEATVAALTHATPGSVVLLSPGGASFDLYANFVERGNHFKKLVQQHSAQKATV